MNDLFANPLFGGCLCIFAYELGLYCKSKWNTPLMNPLLISVLLIVAVLAVFRIPLEAFQNGGQLITLFLGPATAALALPVYQKLALLKKNALPIVAGCLAGTLVSLGSVYALCKLFGLDQAATASLLPKSVTTPIAMSISSQLGGIPSITVAAVIVTGILGAIFSPLLIKLFRVSDPVAQGVAIGTSSHAVGTSKAVELGQTQGAMSGIAIGIAGILTVFISLLL